MSSQDRSERTDGFSTRPISSSPAPPPPPRRRRREDEHERHDGFPTALVAVLVGLGLVAIVGVFSGLMFWLILADDADEPVAFAPMNIQDDPPWFPDNRVAQGLAPGPWPDMPFAAKPIEAPRPPFEAKGRLVPLDLKAKINWARDQAIDLGGNDLGDMPMGETNFAGIKFHVQGGAILLGGRPNPPSGRPLNVDGIGVEGKCKRLYAFQTAHYAIFDKAEIGGYRLRYEDGQAAILPIVYGEDVSDWFFGNVPTGERARVGWSGRNGASAITFYVSRYENPHPEKTITSIDFFATNAGAAPACVALTLEE